MIDLIVNGENHSVPEGSLLDLIHHFKLKKQWTIAELNGQAIEREAYENTVLKTADKVELIRAVAGG